MGANTRDAPKLSGLFLARRRRRPSGVADLLVKSNPGDAAPAVFGDLLFETPAAGGNYVLTALGGTYTVAGGAAVIERDRNLTASGGSYSVSGASAILEKDRRLTASGGAYAVAGGQAVIYRDRRLTATGGAYTLTGGQAVITYTPSAVNYTLTALGGTYLLAGSTAVLAKQYKLTASGGQYGVAPTNLLLRSEEFDNAAWSKSNSSIVANATTSPDGALVAEKLRESATTAGHYVTQSYSMTVGVTYSGSIYLKAAERGFAFLGFNGAATGSVFASVDLTTGAISGAIGALNSFTSTNVGGGWWRVSVTKTAIATNTSTLDCRISTNGVWANQSYLGDGTSGIYVWGAQLEVGSTVGGYTQTTTAAKTLPTANITRNRNLTAQGGAYSLAGGSANITKTSTNAYVLTALGGSYAIAGSSAAIVLPQPIGGGGPGNAQQKGKRKGWANERALFELSQEVQQAQQTLFESTNETARSIAVKIADYSQEIERFNELQAEFAKLQAQYDNANQMEGDLRQAAQVVKEFLQDEQDVIDLLHLMEDFDARCVITASTKPFNLVSLMG